MTSGTTVKRKRNNPCENCRTHRRRCTVSQGERCDRCVHMALPCTFKISASPVVTRKTAPLVKGTRLMEEVLWLEQEIIAFEKNLKHIKFHFGLRYEWPSLALADMDLNCRHQNQLCFNPSQVIRHGDSKNWSSHGEECQQPEVLRKRKKERPVDVWDLSVIQQNGKRIQVTIRTVADMAVFLHEVCKLFSCESPSRSPVYYTDRIQHKMTLTYKTLRVEQVLKNMFTKNTPKDTAPSSTLLPVDNTYTAIQRHLINAYFSCVGLLKPWLVQPYYLPLLTSQPNSMLACAIASFVGYTQCQHAVIKGMPSDTKRQVMELFRQEARTKLQDILFGDTEPDVDTIGTLLALVQSSLILLRSNEARIYLGIAMQMWMQLKDQCLAILQKPDQASYVRGVKAETWRRMSYVIRDLDVSVHLLHSEHPGVALAFASQNIVGEPTLLACEKDHPHLVKAVETYRQIIRLANCYDKRRMSNVGFSLLTGNVDRVLCSDIERLENELFTFWTSLPASHRFSDKLMDYIPLEKVQQCQDLHVLYLNNLYYACWLDLEIRLMASPAHADLHNVSAINLDGERALVIVSICCDIMAKISQVLSTRLPCIIDFHLILIASDVMGMLANAYDPRIRARAKQNLHIALDILKSRVNFQSTDPPGYGFCSSSHPSSDKCSASTVSNITSSSNCSLNPYPNPNTTWLLHSENVSLSSYNTTSTNNTANPPETLGVGPVNYIHGVKQTLENYFTV